MWTAAFWEPAWCRGSPRSEPATIFVPKINFFPLINDIVSFSGVPTKRAHTRNYSESVHFHGGAWGVSQMAACRKRDCVSPQSLLLELETDKAIIDVPAPADGIMLKILTHQGLVRVEEVVGWVGAPGESLDTVVAQKPEKVLQTADGGACGSAGAAPHHHTAADTFGSPAAGELGIDLATLTGTGPHGRITEEDVEQVRLWRRLPLPKPAERARGELGRALSHAWQTIPHIHISRRLDADSLAAWSEKIRPGNISVTECLLFTLSRLLPSMPEMTHCWRDERLEPASGLHLAFAVDTAYGVVQPVIRNVDSLSLEQISQCRRELSGAAQRHQTRMADLNAAVFTLTNLGMTGVDFFAPIVNWPQTAILATGRMTAEPVVRDGSIQIGWPYVGKCGP